MAGINKFKPQAAKRNMSVLELVLDTLNREGSIAAAARYLGVNQFTLQKKVKTLGIESKTRYYVRDER